MSSTDKEKRDFSFTTEWINFLLFLGGLALIYIYLTHRTDNIVRDIDRTKKEIVELRAENITLKSEIIQERSRESIARRLELKALKEPNKAVKKIEISEDEH